MALTLIQFPATARRGEVIPIRALIGHAMETGYRPGADGRLLARNIIRRFSCHYNGELVFSAEFFAAMSANPYLAFHTLATSSGSLSFRWEGDQGFVHSESAPITVTA